MDAEDRVLTVAGAIADGTSVDWTTAETLGGEGREGAVIRELRIVAEIARVSEEVRSAEPDSSGRTQASRDLTNPANTKRKDDVHLQAPLPRLGTWGHLSLLERIGEGAYGEVYRAWDPSLDREVALKLLRFSPGSHAAVTRSIVEEGRILARVRHPNVVVVHGAGEHAGRTGIWMEMVRGKALQTILKEQGPFGAREAAVIGMDLCGALAAVHAVGLIHRDIKGQNVMREERGRIVLMDFGAGSTPQDREGGKASPALAGTPAYMAPEVLFAGQATIQTDIYALGVLLFHLVSGSFPVEARTLGELRDAHRAGRYRPLRDTRPDLPDAFVRVVERALAPAPADRYGSAGEMQRALGTAVGVEHSSGSGVVAERPASRSTQAHRWALVMAIGVLAVVIAVLTLKSGPVGPADASRTGQTADAPGNGVKAELYREGLVAAEPIEDGGRVTRGDRLSLRIESREAVHLYVLNVDDAGKAYLLFPLADLDLKNPLPAGLKHSVPGTLGGRPITWRVEAAGRRESFLVVASRERLTDLEREIGQLDAAKMTKPVQVGADVVAALRGVESLAPAEESSLGDAARRITRLLREAGARGGGLYIREFHLYGSGS